MGAGSGTLATARGMTVPKSKSDCAMLD